ncbi:hypothetical protein K8S19_08035 [bacterium]|nr:hypothetical protein [bacterium]
MGSNIPLFMLEQYLLEELPADRMKAIARQLKTDSDLQQALASLKQSNQAIAQAYPASGMVAAIRCKTMPASQTGRQKWFPGKFTFPVLSMAAVAVVLFLAWPALQINVFHSGETTRIKGNESRLFVYRKSEQSIDLLKNNQTVGRGDLLQIAYHSEAQSFGVILSIDGARQVTLHFPRTPDDTTKLAAAKKTLLPAAYELDDAPDFERFFFITSAVELDVQSTLQAARALAENTQQAIHAPLALPKDWQQISVVLKKGDH